MSSLSFDVLNKLLQSLSIKSISTDIDFSTVALKSSNGYLWKIDSHDGNLQNENSPENREGCMKYLKNHLAIPRKVDVHDVSCFKTLCISFEGGHIKGSLHEYLLIYCF